MNVLRDAIDFIREKPDQFREALWLHVRLSFAALVVALVLFVPIGVACSRSRRVGPVVVGALSSLRVIPSLAVLFLLFPYRRDIGVLIPFEQRTFSIALIALVLFVGTPVGQGLPSAVATFVGVVDDAATPALTNAPGENGAVG